MPSTVGSALRPSTSAKSSSCVIVTGGRISRLVMPISAEVFSFFFTYETEAGSSPTRTRAMQGLRPLKVATWALSSATMSAAIWFPSMSSMEAEKKGAGPRGDRPVEKRLFELDGFGRDHDILAVNRVADRAGDTDVAIYKRIDLLRGRHAPHVHV